MTAARVHSPRSGRADGSSYRMPHVQTGCPAGFPTFRRAVLPHAPRADGLSCRFPHARTGLLATFRTRETGLKSSLTRSHCCATSPEGDSPVDPTRFRRRERSGSTGEFRCARSRRLSSACSHPSRKRGATCGPASSSHGGGACRRAVRRAAPSRPSTSLAHVDRSAARCPALTRCQVPGHTGAIPVTESRFSNYRSPSTS